MEVVFRSVINWPTISRSTSQDCGSGSVRNRILTDSVVDPDPSIFWTIWIHHYFWRPLSRRAGYGHRNRIRVRMSVVRIRSEPDPYQNDTDSLHSQHRLRIGTRPQTWNEYCHFWISLIVGFWLARAKRFIILVGFLVRKTCVNFL